MNFTTIYIKLIVLAVLLLIGCDRHRGAVVSYPDGIENTAHNRARKLCKSGAPASEYMALQEQAVREVRDGVSCHDPVSVLSQMAYFQSRNSNQALAIEYLQEAMDWRHAHPEGETREDIMMLGDLANMYAFLGMYDEAAHVYSEAIVMSERYNHYVYDDLLRFKAKMFAENEQFDSAMIYYDLALESLDRYPAQKDLKMLKAGIRGDKAMIWVENADLFCDSLARAIDYLEDAVKTGGRGVDMERFVLGRALILEGYNDRGLHMMEDAARRIEESGFNAGIEYAYKWLMTSYSELGYDRRAAELYPRYSVFRDSVEAEKRVNSAIAADVRYRASKKEAENARLQAQIKRTHRGVAGLIAGGVVVAILAGWFIMRLRKALLRSQLRRRQQMNKITALLESQKKLSQHIQALNRHLEENTAKELLAGERVEINSQTLMKDSEPRFRKAFSVVHPEFLPTVRAKWPSITKKDELFLMLVYMHQSTDEIATALSISRASVNSARFRIRKKMGLDKDQSLDDVIRNIIPVVINPASDQCGHSPE